MGHPALSAALAQPAASRGTATHTPSKNLLKNTPVKGNVFSVEHHHTRNPPAKQPPAASCTRGHSLARPIPTWAPLRVSAVSGDETSTHGHTPGLPQNPQVSAPLPIVHHCLPLGASGTRKPPECALCSTQKPAVPAPHPILAAPAAPEPRAAAQHGPCCPEAPGALPALTSGSGIPLMMRSGCWGLCPVKVWW